MENIWQIHWFCAKSIPLNFAHSIENISIVCIVNFFSSAYLTLLTTYFDSAYETRSTSGIFTMIFFHLDLTQIALWWRIFSSDIHVVALIMSCIISLFNSIQVQKTIVAIVPLLISSVSINHIYSYYIHNICTVQFILNITRSYSGMRRHVPLKKKTSWGNLLFWRSWGQ